MTEISAAMGLTNLAKIDKVLEVNKCNYQAYKAKLESFPEVKLLSYDESEANNFQYIVVELMRGNAETRDQIIEALHAENIRARKYFWPGCHNMKPYRELYPHANLLLPNTEIVSDRIIVLPTGTSVSEDAIETIANVLGLLVKDIG